MKNFVVLHYQKNAGLSSGALGLHIMRGRENELGEWIPNIPTNADPTRSHLNQQLIDPSGSMSLEHRISERIKAGIGNRTVRGNQVRSINVILSMSPDAAKRIMEEGNLGAWCSSSIQWLQQTHGAANIVSAMLHMDEKTPHIHATLIPIVTGKSKDQKYREAKEAEAGDIKKKRKYKKASEDTMRLCAADVMSKTKLKSYQTSYANAMASFGLERGIDGSMARHIDLNDWYKELVVKCHDKQNDLQELENAVRERSGTLAKVSSALEGTMKGAYDGAKDLFTGKARRRVKAAEDQVAKTKQQAEAQIAQANAQASEATEQLKQVQSEKDKVVRAWKSRQADLEQLDKYKDIAYRADKEVKDVNNQMAYRETMIAKFVQYGAVMADQWRRLFDGEVVQTSHIYLNETPIPLQKPLALRLENGRNLELYDQHWCNENGFWNGILRGLTELFNTGSDVYRWVISTLNRGNGRGI